MQVAIEPREKAVLDPVVDRDRDLGAGRTDFGEINQTNHFNVSAGRFERELVFAIGIHGQKRGASLKTKRTAEADRR